MSSFASGRACPAVDVVDVAPGIGPARVNEAEHNEKTSNQSATVAAISADTCAPASRPLAIKLRSCHRRLLRRDAAPRARNSAFAIATSGSMSRRPSTPIVRRQRAAIKASTCAATPSATVWSAIEIISSESSNQESSIVAVRDMSTRSAKAEPRAELRDLHGEWRKWPCMRRCARLRDPGTDDFFL